MFPGTPPTAVEVTLNIVDCLYSWTAAYEQRGRLITVRIQLIRESNVTPAQLAQAQARWTTGIRAKWNNRFACCDNQAGQTTTDCAQVLPLIFAPQFVTSNPHHTVRIHRGPGNAEMLDWYHDTSEDTAAHEFGHMLRNLDEYFDSNCPRAATDTVMAVVTGPVVKRHVVFVCEALAAGTVPV